MWQRVGLSGYTHTIPPVCPNCMAPADVPVRCHHKELFMCFFHPFGPAGQTFFYCEECADGARAGVRCDRLKRHLTWVISLVALMGVLSLILGPLIGPGGPLWPHWEPVPQPVKLLTILGGIVLLWWLVVGTYRRSQKRRFPKSDAQAVWGVAAYYTGLDNYKAARPEWLAALVRSNPDLVSDRTRRRVLGETDEAAS